MPFSNTASSFFGNVQPLTNAGNPVGSMIEAAKFKTPNLFDTIQAVRANELDRQTKQAAIAKVLNDLQQAPQDKLLKELQAQKIIYDMQLKTPHNQAKLDEIRTMSSAGYQPTSNTMPNREELLSLGKSPEARLQRKNILQSRTEYGVPGAMQGPITTARFVPKVTVDKNPQLQVDPDVAYKIATYQVDIKTIPGFGKSSVRSAYLKAAVQANPNYDQKQYAAASKFITGLADTKRGTPGGIVNSANTLIGHLDYLDNQIDDLHNSGLPVQNALVNFAKYNLGKPEITNFGQALEVVNAEMETLLSGVGVTQQGLSARRVLLNKDSSYEQQKGAIKTLIEVMRKRVQPIEAQYKRYGGDEPNAILSDESRAILDRIGGGSGSDASSELDAINKRLAELGG